MSGKTKILLGLVIVVALGFLLWWRSDVWQPQSVSIAAGESGNFLKSPSASGFWGFLAKADGWRREKRREKNSSPTPISPLPIPTPAPVPAPSPTNPSTFTDDFSATTKIAEAGSVDESANSNWWVNSGAWLIVDSGLGQTVQGDLAATDPWFQVYLKSNALDTDGGLHPQNIFRLVQTSQWLNFFQQNYFRINRLNLSASPNRNASNGLFLFNRYQGGDDLYYTGLRVDGAAVIKKKINGNYYTMAYQPLFNTGGQVYHRDTNPNLLPLDTWIGLKSEVMTEADGRVRIRLYTDVNRAGIWTLALEALDDGVKYGGAAISNAGYAGLRSDFLDLDLDDYAINAP